MSFLPSLRATSSRLVAPASLPLRPAAAGAGAGVVIIRRGLTSTRPIYADEKVPVALIASLRRARPVPMSLARQALASSSNDLERALRWLDTQQSSAEAKAAKVSGRSTHEGAIAISLLSGKRVGMVHLGCETDFVARNDVFLRTAQGVAGTAAFLDVPSEGEPQAPKEGVDPILEWPVEALLSAPLIALPASSSSSSSPSPSSGLPEPIPTTDPQTIQQSLLSALSSTGENLKLLRASSFAAPFPSSPTIRYIPGCYAHGGQTPLTGKVGGLVVLSAASADPEKPMASLVHGPGGEELEQALGKMARDVARQVVGFPTRLVSRGTSEGEAAEEEVLLEQVFMMLGEERKVDEVLDEWGKERGIKVNVVGMRRWSVSDRLGDPAADGVEAA